MPCGDNTTREYDTMSDQEIRILAFQHIDKELRADWPRVNVLGEDGNGILDLQFHSLFYAMEWTARHRADPYVDFRDPVAHPTDSVVLQVNLYDYARRHKLYRPSTTQPETVVVRGRRVPLLNYDDGLSGFCPPDVSGNQS